MTAPSITFIGFGEVASVFSEALSTNGAQLSAFDPKVVGPDGLAVLQSRARVPGIRFLPLAEAVRDADLVLSTVPPQAAPEVARQCAACLTPGQIYVDFASTTPATKIALARIIDGCGAGFVEGVILGAVGVTGAATPALTAGKRGADVAGTLRRLGLNVSFFEGALGQASLFKLLRSIFSKGLEALLLETLIAARKAGLGQQLWDEVVHDLMGRSSFERIASNWILTHPAACTRRWHEVRDVVATLEELGVEPTVSRGTELFFARSSAMGLGRAFPTRPQTPHAVVDFMTPQAGGVS